MIRGIHHVGMHAHDIDRMVQFYGDAFGFKPVDPGFSWENEPVLDKLIDVPGSAARGIMLKAGSCYLEMFQFNAPKPANKGGINPNDKGYTHFCVDVTEIEKEVERLKGLGMTFGAGAPIDMGHVKSVYGRDPEGNVIEIQETQSNCDFKLSALPPLPA